VDGTEARMGAGQRPHGLNDLTDDGFRCRGCRHGRVSSGRGHRVRGGVCHKASRAVQIAHRAGRAARTQVYEKAGSSLQVLIYEGWYYTRAEVSSTRVIGRELAPAR
jgi:hypothetical protein